MSRSSTLSDATTRLDEYLSSQEGIDLPYRAVTPNQPEKYPVKTILYSQGIPVARRTVHHKLDTLKVGLTQSSDTYSRALDEPIDHRTEPSSSAPPSRSSYNTPAIWKASGLSLPDKLECDEVLTEYLRGLRRIMSTTDARIKSSQEGFFQRRAEKLHEALSRRLGKMISRRNKTERCRRSRLRAVDLSPISIDGDMSPRRPPQRIRSSSPLSRRMVTDDYYRDRGRSSSQGRGFSRGDVSRSVWGFPRQSIESLPRSTPESSCVSYPMHSRQVPCRGSQDIFQRLSTVEARKPEPIIITGFEEFDEESKEKRRESGRVLIGSTEDIYGTMEQKAGADRGKFLTECIEKPEVPMSSREPEEGTVGYRFTSIDFMDSRKSALLSKTSLPR